MNIYTICDKIKEVFTDKLRVPARKISGIIMLCSLAKRPGLSPLISTARIIQDISKKGLVTEDMPDGTPNLMNKLIYSIVSEVYRAIREDANIQIGFAPGAFNITVTGSNAGGPVVAQGVNINYGTGVGVAQ